MKIFRRGILRHFIVGAMILGFAQNVVAAAMCGCACPCCTKKTPSGGDGCKSEQKTEKTDSCYHAALKKSCCAKSQKAALCHSDSLAPSVKAPSCDCRFQPLPAQIPGRNDSLKPTLKSLAVEGIWLSPTALFSASVQTVILTAPLPYSGPSLQQLLCVWRK